MSVPTVLIHGYSSEGKTSDTAAYTRQQLAGLYGSLPDDLAARGFTTVPVNLSRYVSLDDGVDVDDLSLALQRALTQDYPALLSGGFNAIIHSTGALVSRNWIRRHTTPNGKCPLQRLIHLAGANLGSGWASVGSTQFAKFARLIQGTQRGLAVLNDLELASDWAIDLHTHFLQPGHDMLNDYGVMEFNLVGSQVPPEYLPIPVRYGKEDGCDGVVRVSASNLNFNYIKIGPTMSAQDLDWDQAVNYAKTALKPTGTNALKQEIFDNGFYELRFDARPGSPPVGSEVEEYKAADLKCGGAGTVASRPQIPFAIPYGTCHSDMAGKTGIVSGSQNREAVLPLIGQALGATRASYPGMVSIFQSATDATYATVKTGQHDQGLLQRLATAVKNLLDNPKAQYDPHSQLVFRIRDHLGQPVSDYSIFFNSFGAGGAPTQLINGLFEDQHKNDNTPNTMNFYVRTETYDSTSNDWISQLTPINGVSLEIDAIDHATQRVLYLPLRMAIGADDLAQWIQPHRTTIVDVQLIRLPAKVTFIIR